MRRIKRTAVWVLICLAAPAGLEAVEGVVLLPRTTGWFHADLKHMVAGAPSEKVRIPIPFYVIRHPQGVVLFDSGLGENFREQIDGWWAHRLFQLLLPYEFEKSEAAVHQLERMGLGPESVRFLVISHLHLDHAGGLRDFPKATIVVSRAEWGNADVGRWLARLRGVVKEQLEGARERLLIIENGDDGPVKALEPFETGFDLFGDGYLLVLPTPGHTPGHQSLLVTLGSGKRVLLTGDAVWVRENYLKPAPKGWFVRHLEEDAEPTWETTLKIREFAEKHPDVLIIPGHDPRVWEELPDEIQ